LGAGQTKERKNQIGHLTLDIRGRQEVTVSKEEVQQAFAQFDDLWGELDNEERRAAIRLLIKEIRVRIKKGKKEGGMLPEVWGRHSQPLKRKFRNSRGGKLRNQDGLIQESFYKSKGLKAMPLTES
jgi:hypothetical protein